MPSTELATVQVKMIDRSSQRLANLLGLFFAVSSGLCVFAIALLGVFFTTIVAEEGETGMIPILSGIGATFILGMLLLEFAHVRALAGQRASRTRNALRSRAGLAVAICLAFCVIHPLMGAAIPLGAGMGILGQRVLARFARAEPFWDVLPPEAVSVLAGRDRTGHALAGASPRHHALAGTLARSGSILAVIASLATGSYLIAQDIMTVAALVPLILGTLWAVEAILDDTADRCAQREVKLTSHAQVRGGELPQDAAEHVGLSVHHLDVRGPNGTPLLSDINLQVDPGTITGIIGPSGAGKSLLLQAIADPFALSDMEVSGAVRQNGADLWQRHGTEQLTPAVLLPSEPVLLPASGADNLSCFHGDQLLRRGKWLLEQLVFASDMVDTICAATDARLLPSMQIRALVLARAFMLGPQLYLMDRPESGLPDPQISALLNRLNQETRMGRNVVLVTDNRRLLDICDRLIVLHDGRIVDYGETEEVRARIISGWSRFRGVRKLETEDNLQNWIRAHFRRQGDEANCRRVAGVAADMLALSCQSANPVDPGQISFLFKHFKGHCVLRMLDRDTPISAGRIQRARAEVEGRTADTRLSLLGRIAADVLDIETGSERDERLLDVKIETYDPRQGAVQPEAGHVDIRP